MKFDTIELTTGSEMVNVVLKSGTQAERLALTGMSGGELFSQLDGISGLYTFVGGVWVPPATSNSTPAIIDLPNYIGAGISYSLFIVNYNNFSVYTVSVAGGGSATIKGNIISYTARPTIGIDIITLNQDDTDTAFSVTAVSAQTIMTTIVNEQNYRVTTDSAGNVYTLGSELSLTNNSAVTKYDSDLNFIWKAVLPARTGSTMHHIKVTTLGIYIAANGFVMMLDLEGKTVWSKTWVGTTQIRYSSGFDVNTSELFVLGSYNSSIHWWYCARLSPVTGGQLSGEGTQGITDTYGSYQYKHIASYGGFEYVISAGQDNGGSKYAQRINVWKGLVDAATTVYHKQHNYTSITGYVRDMKLDSSGMYTVGQHKIDTVNIVPYIMKFGLSDGNYDWCREFTDPLVGPSSSISGFQVTLGNSSVYATGSIHNRNGSARYAGFIVKVNKSTGAVEKYSVMESTDDHVYFTGSYVHKSTGDLYIVGRLGSATGSPGFVIKTDSELSWIGTPPSRSDVTFLTDEAINSASRGFSVTTLATTAPANVSFSIPNFTSPNAEFPGIKEHTTDYL